MTQLSIRRATGYVVTAAAAWGTGGAAGSLLFAAGGFDALDVTFWRFLLGAAFLLPLLGGASWRLDRHVLVVGAGMAVYQAAYFAAIARSGVAVATVITMGATPVFTALGGRLLLGERLGRSGLAALLAALTGLALLMAGSPEAPGGSGAGGALGGAGFALLSAFGYAGVTLLSRRLGTAEEPGDPLATAAAGFLVGAACVLPFALAGGVLPRLSWESAALLAFLGAVPTALAYGLFFRALTALSATTVAIVSLGEAAFAALIGVALLGERPGPAGWAGCALLLLAGVFPARRARG
ncbi:MULTISPECIES: DMT family transporter [Nonomuraea]|uniref:EamA family transporter n=1 Tax=Nonomuraea ferruginea TaxID=46174 RepID=A0ABT4SRY4_9ACTN|nr:MULTISPECIES: EamA family transporter [Nonomuraea]MDA0640032.1 EamA family transporter [Nonomuraea ferruginea]TXK38771.1 EamA family transporter [Nonomuraea sp. C10]